MRNNLLKTNEDQTMKEITFEQVPRDGQSFITIHSFGGGLWSQTLRYKTKHCLQSYFEAEDRWVNTPTLLIPKCGICRKYYIVN